MPDLNQLLRWSIANTPASTPAPPASTTESSEPLSLQFRPTTQPHPANSALHPSDPLYQSSHSDSAASTPGPTTPTNGTSSLPAIPARRSDLTTEMLDHIMGKGDSAIMKEKMAFAMDETNSEDDRVEALDDFEMVSTNNYRYSWLIGIEFSSLR
jgi:hsp70-interacting protein